MEYMLMPYKKLYRLIEGRSSRREFWMFVLLNVIVIAAFALLMFLLVGGMSALEPQNMAAFTAGMGVTAIILIVPFYIFFALTGVAAIAVSIRRLHDLNLTGWIYVGFMVLSAIPLINFLAFIVYIVVMALPGTKGANKYGEDPTQDVSVATFA